MWDKIFNTLWTSGMFLALYLSHGGIGMGMTETEKTHVSAKGFDLRPPYEALDILVTAQMSAAWSVRAALRDIARASEVMADAVAAGGNLVYAAAGSSALMAMADGLELPGTYGIPRDREGRSSRYPSPYMLPGPAFSWEGNSCQESRGASRLHV